VLEGVLDVDVTRAAHRGAVAGRGRGVDVRRTAVVAVRRRERCRVDVRRAGAFVIVRHQRRARDDAPCEEGRQDHDGQARGAGHRVRRG
jgi:hypothetical protein